MGSCSSKNKQDGEQSRDLEVDDALTKAQEEVRNKIRILLLGAGECGKSTVLKQMKILHKNGFTADERRECAGTIRKNTITSIQQLIIGCQELQYMFEKNFEAKAKAVMDISDANSVSSTHIDYIEDLWKNSKTIKKVVENAYEIHLLDSFRYFLDRIRPIYEEKYSPTDQDILRSRKETVGIVETKFEIGKGKFVMYDVGGQRGERKKWIHCFEGVRAIMYVASLSEYDQTLVEDHKKNRMEESLTLFSGILSLLWFRSTPVILFLNKHDLFKEKIKSSELGRYFSDYHGGLDEKMAIEYIKKLYMRCNDKYPNRSIYPHITNATNTDNIDFVWNASKNIILCANLEATGLIF